MAPLLCNLGANSTRIAHGLYMDCARDVHGLYLDSLPSCSAKAPLSSDLTYLTELFSDTLSRPCGNYRILFCICEPHDDNQNEKRKKAEANFRDIFLQGGAALTNRIMT